MKEETKASLIMFLISILVLIGLVTYKINSKELNQSQNIEELVYKCYKEKFGCDFESVNERYINEMKKFHINTSLSKEALLVLPNGIPFNKFFPI